jgi:pyruvate dehydrogenase E1 component alpha subunit
VIYVCENNLYTEYTHYSETTAGDIPARAAAFGIPAETVDGQDAVAIYNAAECFVRRARRGEGPAFLLSNTYRYHGHHVGDLSRDYYRSKQEEQHWKERDPLKLLSARLLKEGVIEKASLAAIDSEVNSEMDAAAKFAIAAPYPKTAEVDQDIYV